MSKGVIVVKAAGNAGSDGPFRADVATAVGAITVASVDASKDSSSGVSVSKFSSYGPVSVVGEREDTPAHVCVWGGAVQGLSARERGGTYASKQRRRTNTVV